MSVGELIGEPLSVHGIASGKEKATRVAELLAKVGLLPDYANRYPHEFSGGQRQRIGIARALACGPSLLIGDEPVSALDVSIRAQVINLLEDLKAEFGLTIILVAHDLAVIRHTSDRVAVMYLGEIVELADAATLFSRPLHPYTRMLMAAIPVPDPRARSAEPVTEGDLPSPTAPPPGCRFHPRCPHARARCRQEHPALRDSVVGHAVACHFAEEIAAGQPAGLALPPESQNRRRRIALFAAAQAAGGAAPPP
jgi:peptide/nickel transport system ATP-binding protein